MTEIITDINERWERGIPHHSKAIELGKKLQNFDKENLYCLDLDFGGDGDNGENLLFALSAIFEQEDSSPPEYPDASELTKKLFNDTFTLWNCFAGADFAKDSDTIMTVIMYLEREGHLVSPMTQKESSELIRYHGLEEELVEAYNTGEPEQVWDVVERCLIDR